MLEKTSLIIFDIDGTLFDSVDYNTYNINKALEVVGCTYRVEKECIRKNLGCTAEVFYKNILDEKSLTFLEQIKAQRKAQADEMISQYGKAFEGVYETFKELHERGIKLVLYSNCSRPYLESAVKMIGIEPFLTYAECVKENGLVKTELVKKIMERYKEEQVVVVGDRIHDKEAAEANGIPFIAAMYGYGKEELSDATHQIDTIKELLFKVK